MNIFKKSPSYDKSGESNSSIQNGRRITYQSDNWMIWVAIITPFTCYYCASMHGRILAANDSRIEEIPVHPNCNCSAQPITAVVAGTATKAGINGIDLFVLLSGELPSNYITQSEAKKLGWKKWLGNLDTVLPGKIIGGDIYHNRDHRLPELPGRIWHEADFDYSKGFRNNCRILYSNDGLVFATYDHYMTFYEIGMGNH